MRYVFAVLILGAIIGIGAWLHKAPVEPIVPDTNMPSEASMSGPQTPPAVATPTTAPSTVKNKAVIRTINTNNNMKIEITKEGTGDEIKNGQTAVVDYVGKLTDGTVFDASQKHGQTFSFTLGAGQVIKGWDEGVLGMKVGEMRTLTIPSDLAYGVNGIPGAIPGGATLIFDVTLQGIK